MRSTKTERSDTMRKFLFVAFIFALIMAGISETAVDEKAANEQSEETINKEIDNILKDMTTEEKIGQLVIMGIDGESVTEDAEFLLKEYHIGGVILFDRNMKNPEQVKSLTASLNETAGGKLPLFIATDEEGGAAARLKDFIKPPLAAKILGDSGDAKKAFDEMKTASQAFNELGFNLNFAPVADLNLVNDRFYSTDSNAAANFVTEAAAGVYDGGMIPCVKHFPGLGSVAYQNGVAAVNKTKAELMATDIYPYERLKEANFPYFIMVNHVVYGSLDKEPASLSKVVIKNILREELNFDGAVIADDISGGALPKYKPAERAVKTITAGADMVLSCNTAKETREIYLGLLDAKKKGKFSEERLNQSVKRILKAKFLLKGKQNL